LKMVVSRGSADTRAESNRAMRKIAGVLVIVSAVVMGPLRARADLTPQQVSEAIDRAVAFLRRQQNNNGTWPDQTALVVGVTALCTLALLNAGVPPEDPAIQKSLRYLRPLDRKQTYVVALQTMVFCAAESKDDLLLIRRNVNWLQETQVKTGDRKGAWSYPN